jgi:hypothetical protein
LRVDSFFSTSSDTVEASRQLLQALANAGLPAPQLAILHGSVNFDLPLLQKILTASLPCPLHGATSCKGVMTHSGHSVASSSGVALFVISDADGDYGVACQSFDDNPKLTAEAAVRTAIANAGRTGELPDLIWLSATPGSEDLVLAGLREVVGHSVPIVGGSAADNSISGEWRVFDRDVIYQSGLTISVFFPSGHVFDVFQSGYTPTENSGMVTKAESRRILEIDGKPAAVVYDEWTSGQVLPVGESEASILMESTLWPLGRTKGLHVEDHDYLLVHPSSRHADESISVFADVAVGETVTQMSGDKQSLVYRAGRVSSLAMSGLERSGSQPLGGLVVFCAGCMLSVQDQMDDVVREINAGLEGLPFLGVFTFGEQGRLQSGGSLHGNLMISCTVFGD